ncbi:MAG TPA: hypothetical protein DCL21_00975 [Alphaproteobacteria bacterium]|nr:hypothetical protein [Alphaproteobacteria bacterium]
MSLNYNFPETLVGDTIILEKLEQFHAEDLYSVIDANRDYIAKYLPWMTENYRFEDTAKFVSMKEENFEDQDGFAYVIINKETDEVLGSVGLSIKSKGSSELGYWLAENQQGNGIMSQAIDLLVEYAFEETPIIRVDIFTLPDNKKSMQVAKRNGFLFEGVRYHQQIDLDGSFIDGVRFTKLKDKSVMHNLKDKEEQLIDVFNVKLLKNK